MLYILGLGNPEPQHQHTAHNIGWQMIDEIIEHYRLDFSTLELNNHALRAQGQIAGHPVVCIKPTTYMNNSGKTLAMYKPNLDPSQLVVIYDDIDLPFGTVKLARNRGDGGHNGIKSITQELGDKNYIRIRIGVCPLDWFGNPRKPRGTRSVANYLVSKQLSRRAQKQYPSIATDVIRLLESLLQEGYEKTISRQ